MNITVLGGGSWGTALAIHLRRNGHNVKIWEFFKEQADQMQKERYCPLLPEKIHIDESIKITSVLEEALEDSDAVFIVVPSNKVEVTLQNAKQFITDQKIVLCSKGFAENQELQTKAVENILPENEIYCLYGPTLALELAKGLLTGIVLAGKTDKTKLKQAIESDILKVDTTDDTVGVQIGAALKNVVTIFVGIVEGMELGQNAKAYVFTKGLNEIKEIGVAMGAKPETFLGLTAVGDLTLQSRNRMLGVEIGKGRKLEEILAQTNHVSEGVIAIQNAIVLKDRLGLDLPVISELNKILFENKSPKEALTNI